MEKIVLAFSALAGVFLYWENQYLLAGEDALKSPRISKLVCESKMKKCICYSDLFETNPLEPDDVSLCLEYIRSNKDYSSYFLLFALKNYYPKAYRMISDADKAKILCSTLANAKAMNDWGCYTQKDSFDGISGKWILELGVASVGGLKDLLDDSRPAHLNGSQQSTTSLKYGYRRKDFAYRYAAVILGRSPRFDADPAARDTEIEALKELLNKK